MTFREQLQTLKTQVDTQTTALQKAQFVYDYIKAQIKAEEEAKAEGLALSQTAQNAFQLIKTAKINSLKALGFKCDGSLDDFKRVLVEGKSTANLDQNANYYASVTDKEQALINLYENFFGTIK